MMRRWPPSLKLKSEEKRNQPSPLTEMCVLFSIEHDANLLANRIALLKQEEMKTWKKIEDTRKRTNEITSLKNRNEERIR